MERDQVVDQVFEVAGLPLIHIAAKASYNVAALLAEIEPHLSGPKRAKAVPAAASPSVPPSCPKCGVSMIQQVAKQGPKAGQRFFGCPNYPRCKEIVEAVYAVLA
jgi:hypothetical protein